MHVKERVLAARSGGDGEVKEGVLEDTCMHKGAHNGQQTDYGDQDRYYEHGQRGGDLGAAHLLHLTDISKMLPGGYYER